MLTGKRDRFLGLPPAGVAPEIHGAAVSAALADALARNAETTSQPMLTGLRAVTVNPRLAISERAGRRAFGVWSRLIRAFGQRAMAAAPASCWFFALSDCDGLTVVPSSLLLQWLLSPLLKSRLEGCALGWSFKRVSGIQSENMTSRVGAYITGTSSFLPNPR